VRDSGSSWSYATLGARSHQWAARLHAMGVRRGARVALLCARRADVVAAVLGIARAGAAFVPLDPSWPADRIRLVLEDCAPVCVVVDAASSHVARDYASIDCGFESGREDAARPLLPPFIDDPAYLMYTSGSTGRQKAVVVGHRSLSNYLRWARTHYFGVGKAPVFPLFTSLAFDLTLTSLLVPLVSGGAIHVVATSEPLVAAREVVENAALTAIKLTPSHLRLLCEVGLRISALRTFIVGGEPLSTALARDATLQSPGISIYNEYGPTEATVGCVVHRFDAQRDLDREVPIGRPIDGARIELIDGEMLISGECVALGYHTPCPESARFVSWRGRRAYRSGDRWTRDVDGNLRFGGRIDDQVKIRGHRIEPAEIECAVLADAAVATAAVVVERGTAAPELVAHVVWSGAPDPEGLRRRLSAILPAAWQPARLVSHVELPLNSNGKLDRRALGARISGSQAVAGQLLSTTESQLRELLADVLQRPMASLDVHASLLEQGCDSLSLAILLQRADATEVLGEFVRDPTLRTLAALLDGRNRAGTPRLR